MNKKILIISIGFLLLFSACKKSETKIKDENVPVIKPSDSIIISEVVTESNIITPSDVQPENETEKTETNIVEEKPEETNEPESVDTHERKYPIDILVNPTHRIPEDYSVNLVQVQGKYKMEEEAAKYAKELLKGAKAAGFNMQLCSAYRTIETSERLYKNKVNEYLALGYSNENAKTEAAKWVAPPGTSEHHTGLAMDLVSSDYWNYYSDLEHDYEKFDSFQWMYDHCWEYGFILRYPKEKQDITGITYEPWHYRYVGLEKAKYIMENKLCLEEYLNP